MNKNKLRAWLLRILAELEETDIKDAEISETFSTTTITIHWKR